MMVIVTFVIIIHVIVGVFGAVVRLGLIRLWFLFDCAGRAQSYAFHALCAPNMMPELGINRLFRSAKQRSRPQAADILAGLLLRVSAAGTQHPQGWGKSLHSWYEGLLAGSNRLGWFWQVRNPESNHCENKRIIGKDNFPESAAGAQISSRGEASSGNRPGLRCEVNCQQLCKLLHIYSLGKYVSY
jgi:hypothetical protein